MEGKNEFVSFAERGDVFSTEGRIPPSAEGEGLVAIDGEFIGGPKSARNRFTNKGDGLGLIQRLMMIMMRMSLPVL